MRKEQNKNSIENFFNEEFGELRVEVINGEPWFVAKDVFNALGIAWNGSRTL